MAQAVEAGEVAAALLIELRAGFDAARETPEEERNAAAVPRIADLAGVPEGEAAQTLAAIDAPPSVVRELLRRLFVDVFPTSN